MSKAGGSGVGGKATGGARASAGEAGETSVGGTSGTAGSVSGGTGGSPDETWTLPVGATLASCIPSNWSVSAAFSREDNPPSFAVDGLPSTRWSNGAAQGPSESFDVAFGGWVTLSQIVLDSAGSPDDYPRGYEVLASKDGVNFTKVLAADAVSATPEGDVVTIDFAPTPLLAIRIRTTVATGNWWSIHELRLECEGSDDGTTPVDPLLCNPQGSDEGAGGAGTGGENAGGSGGGYGDNDEALDAQNWTATASTTNAGDEVEAAFDGALGTRWSSGKAQTGDEWYKLDLGSVACISDLWLVSGGGDFAAALAVEVSVDDVEYVRVWKGASSAVSQIQFPPHSARFVRLKQVGNGGASWWSIQEIEVRR